MSIAVDIEKLLELAVNRNILDPADRIGARNALLDLFGLKQPHLSPVTLEDQDTIPVILDRLVDGAAEAGLVDGSIFELRVLFDTRVMGLLMPKPSTVIASFQRLRDEDSIEAATDYFYNLSIDANYIRMADISRNQSWFGATEYGDIEITINLSKPEKDPRAIALARNQISVQYPQCLLCIENVNYVGRIDFPARQTLRLVPVELADDRWYLQYSPYVYYNEHCIVLSERHEPMVIGRQTFQAILDFVGQFPHYFCGSNADLPIVGGSILNHNHFQGGRAPFAMDKAKVRQVFRHDGFPDVRIAHLHWPLTSLRLSSPSPDSLVDLADRLLTLWRSYDDPTVKVLSSSVQDGQLIPHNTITPIARRNPQGDYELDLVLRNNRTTAELPLGLFHPHPEIHAIKKENIGLIEVMGLAILPGRLLEEMATIREILLGKIPYDSIDQPEHPLWKHRDFILDIQQIGIAGQDQDDIDRLLKAQIAEKFKTGLEHCGVFKLDAPGMAALDRFMQAAGCLDVSEHAAKV